MKTTLILSFTRKALTGICLALAVPALAQFGTNTMTPVVSITAPRASASESGDQGVFVLLRNGPTNATLNVFWQIGGTASNGVDYATLPPSVEIPAGVREVRVPVIPVDDSLAEGTESVVAHLVPPPTAGASPYAIGYSSSASIAIFDNDQTNTTNHAPEVAILTPGYGTVFTAPANIYIAAGARDPDAGDYVATVEFFNGHDSLGIKTNNPASGSSVNPFQLVWSNVPPGEYVLHALATDTHGAHADSAPVKVYVVTNSPPQPTNSYTLVSIAALDGIAAEGSGSIRWSNYCWQPFTNYCGTNTTQRDGTNTARFIVRRHGPTNDSLVVHYHIGGTASNGVDYLQIPNSVQIPAGHRAAEIVIVPIDDPLPEPLETVILGLRLPPDWNTNLPPPYKVGYPARAGAVIVDNDAPRPTTGVLPDHCFHIMHPGTNGTWVRIECSTNMIHWTGICTNMVSDGAVHFVDPDGDNRPSGYYRVVPTMPPPPDY